MKNVTHFIKFCYGQNFDNGFRGSDINSNLWFYNKVLWGKCTLTRHKIPPTCVICERASSFSSIKFFFQNNLWWHFTHTQLRQDFWLTRKSADSCNFPIDFCQILWFALRTSTIVYKNHHLQDYTLRIFITDHLISHYSMSEKEFELSIQA